MLSLLLLVGTIAALRAGEVEAPVKSLRITVLSTNLAEDGVGEWGYAALVEVDGKRLLFDTGQRPETVRDNARELKVNWNGVDEVVLSHHHFDHVGGLLTLRESVSASGPATLAHAHVVRGAFWSRGAGPYEGDENPLIAIKPRYEQAGGSFTEHAGPVELFPGVWLIGPIPRMHAEQEPVGDDQVHLPDGSVVPDTVPDDTALVFDTSRGLVVLTGCGHAGLINTLEQARVVTGRRDAPIYAVAGGFHLLSPSDQSLEWTAGQLKTLGVRFFHGGHCTGLETVYRLRQLLGLPRASVSVASVGSSFDLGTGIDAGEIAR